MATVKSRFGYLNYRDDIDPAVATELDTLNTTLVSTQGVAATVTTDAAASSAAALATQTDATDVSALASAVISLVTVTGDASAAVATANALILSGINVESDLAAVDTDITQIGSVISSSSADATSASNTTTTAAADLSDADVLLETSTIRNSSASIELARARDYLFAKADNVGYTKVTPLTTAAFVYSFTTVSSNNISLSGGSFVLPPTKKFLMALSAEGSTDVLATTSINLIFQDANLTVLIEHPIYFADSNTDITGVLRNRFMNLYYDTTGKTLNERTISPRIRINGSGASNATFTSSPFQCGVLHVCEL